METKKEIMETLAKSLNSNYSTIAELAKEMGYKVPEYVAEKVKKLKLGYRIKNIHLLSKKDKKLLRNSIHRRNQEERNLEDKDNEENKNENEIIEKVEDLLIEDLKVNYCTISELSKREGYNDDSSYLSRKAKRLGLGLRIKTITLLSKEDQEILKKSIKRRGSRLSSQEDKF